jgi:hypothetical protein
VNVSSFQTRPHFFQIDAPANMGNKARKRAQSYMGSSLEEELEEARAALRDKESELNILRARLTHITELAAEKQRTIEVQQRTIKVQLAIQRRYERINDERVRILE